jgi:hypothetical protein
MRGKAGTAGRRGRVAGAVGVAAALALSACSGSSPAPATQPAALPAAAASGAQEGSATSAAKATTPSPKAATSSAAHLAARVSAAALAKGTVRMTVVTMAGGQTLVRASGAVRTRGAGPDLAMTMTAGGQRLSLVVLGGVLYLNFGRPIAGKSWVKIAPTASDPLSRAFGPLLQSLGSSSDVQAQVAALKDAKITSVVSTTADGVRATRYTIAMTERNFRASFDTFKGLSAPVRKAVAAALKGTSGTTVMTVDAKGLVHRVVTIVRGPSRTQTTTVTYRGWGEPVRITAPPPSRVTDLGATVG